MRMHLIIVTLLAVTGIGLAPTMAAADEYEQALEYFVDRAPHVTHGDDVEETNRRLWRKNLKHYGAMSRQELWIHYWGEVICPISHSWATCETKTLRALGALNRSGLSDDRWGDIPMV